MTGIGDLQVHDGDLPLTKLVERSPAQASEQGTQLPVPVYTDRFKRLWTGLDAAGFDPRARLDYSTWAKRLDYSPDEPMRIAAMGRDDLAHLIVRFARGERFCDGYWQSLIDNGALLAAAKRARELADEIS